MEEADKERSCVQRWLSKWVVYTHSVEVAIEDLLAKLGRSAATYPMRYNLFVLFLTIVCAMGFSQIEVVTRGDKLWIPQSSIPAENRDYVESVTSFGRPPRGASILLLAQPGQNAISLDAVGELWTIFGKVKAVRTDEGDDFESLCIREVRSIGASPCLLANSPLRFFDGNHTVYEQQVGGNATKLRSILSQTTLPTGGVLNRNNAYGNFQTNSQDEVINADATRIEFAFDGDKDVEGRAKALEKLLIDELEVEAARIKSDGKYTLAYNLQRSIDDELARSVSGDIGLLVGTYIIMTTFIMLTLGRWHRVYGRKALGGVGVLLVVLAMVASYGLCMWMQIPFTSLQQVLPFILVGIGADDMFVITNTFDRTPKKLPIPERMALTFKRAGLAVTVTSATNCAAFALGATSVIPAIQYFCAYASVSIAFIYFFTLLSFSALLSWDERRRQSGRLDCCCCFSSSHVDADDVMDPNPVTIAVASSAPTLTIDDKEARQKAAQSFEAERTDLSAASKWFRDHYAPALLHPVSKAGVVVFFVALFAFNIYAVTQVEQGFELVDVTPDDSYLRDWFDAQDKQFKNANMPMEVFVKSVDYPKAETQQNLQTYLNQLQANKWGTPPLACWFTSFKAFYKTTPPYNNSLDGHGLLTNSTLFHQGLRAFLQLPAAQVFNRDVHWNADKSVLLASRCHMFHVPSTTSEKRKDLLLSLRSTTRNTPLNARMAFSDRVAFNYNTFYLFWEQFTLIYQELVQNFILSGAAVVFICTLLLVHPAAALILISVIAIIDVGLLASIWVWGLTVSSITVIQLVMSVGLVVDYSAHIIHAFMVQSGDRTQRVIQALTKMGPSVLLGSITTLIGVVPLSLASSTIFRTFFRMFLSIILYGSIHGMVLLPVLLTWFGPSTAHLLPSSKVGRRSVVNLPAEANMTSAELAEL